LGQTIAMDRLPAQQGKARERSEVAAFHLHASERDTVKQL
jgi:hypothetical protein